MDDTIHVAACCDNNYVPYAAVMMLSALKVTPNARLHFHLIDCGITAENLDALSHTVKDAGGELSTYEPDDSLYQGLPTHRYGPAVYQRINLPAYIPDSVSKILYLDSDILVRGDLSKLWHINLNGEPAAAVENYSPKACHDIQVNRTDYFNSGVILMDLTIWRRESLHTLVTDYARNHAERLEFVDQCSLNAVLQGRWLRLPACWNQQSDVYKVMVKYAEGCSYSPEELREAFVAPGIVHFTGKKKPWKLYCFHPFKAEYRDILKQTPWADIPPPDESPVTRLKYGLSLRNHWKYHRRKAQITPIHQDQA